MDIITLFTLSIALSMDAFAVAICKGLSMQRLTVKKAAIVGGWFGSFQALMPVIGYVLGIQFRDKITAIDHWIAFILLLIIGIKMIKESKSSKEDCSVNDGCNESLSVREMFVLAVATSIDALAVGITLAFLNVNIFVAISFIGILTFLLSMLGVKVGHAFGAKYKARAELLGGVALVLMGLKILLEHTGKL